MNKLCWLPLAALVCFALVGCKGETTAPDDSSPAAQSDGTTPVALYCGKCGNEKGTAECCAESGEKCGNCAFHKGSALCCKGVDVAGKDLCGKCGHAAEEGHVCDADHATCEKCGLQEGSALCCKLSKDAESTDSPSQEDLAEEATN